MNADHDRARTNERTTLKGTDTRTDGGLPAGLDDHPRRRAALLAIHYHDGPIHLRHLARLVADREPGDACDHRVALYHSHLVQLADADLVAVTWHTRQVRPTSAGHAVARELEDQR